MMALFILGNTFPFVVCLYSFFSNVFKIIETIAILKKSLQLNMLASSFLRRVSMFFQSIMHRKATDVIGSSPHFELLKATLEIRISCRRTLITGDKPTSRSGSSAHVTTPFVGRDNAELQEAKKMETLGRISSTWRKRLVACQDVVRS